MVKLYKEVSEMKGKRIRIRDTVIYLLLAVIVFSYAVIPVSSIKADAAAFIIEANATTTSSYVGGKLTIKAKGYNGTTPYQYRFIYKLNSGSWKTLKNFSTSNTASFTMSSVGTYTIRSYIKDNKNLQAYCDITVKAKEKYTALTNTSTINSTVITQGQNTIITAKASGGTKPYKYAYYYTPQDGTKKTIKAYSTTAKVTFKLPSAGYYTLQCIVKDNDGKTVTKTFSNVVVKNNTGKTLTNTTIASASTINYGSTVKLTGKATGGVQPYQYSYYYSLDGKTYTKAISYSKSAAANVKLPKVGFYTIKALIKDYSGKVSTKYIYVTAKRDTGRVLSLSSSLNAGNLVDQGAQATIKAKAAGGSEPYKYAYYYKLNSGSWQTLKDYSTAESAVIKFSSGGNYSVKATVKDAAGKTVSKTFSVTSITKQSYANVNKGTKTVDYGYSTDITAEDMGTSAKYAFYYKKASGNSWTKLQSYSSNNTVKFRPRYLDKYIVMIYTKVGAKQYISTYYVTASIPDYIYEVVDLVNAERKKAGCSELKLDTDIVFASGVRAEELNTLYAHTRPDNRDFSTIFDEYDVDYTTINGENIASGYPTPERVVYGWMNSEEHRKNILSTTFTKLGVNKCGKYWNQLFAD